MANEIKFDYFHGNESNIQAFVRVPKALITEPAFASLDNDDRMAYAIMLDRVSLSVKNNWIDKQHRVYIRLTMEQVCEELSVGMSKAQKIFRKLGTKDGVGLIERVNPGQGKASIIYVKNFFVEKKAVVDDVDNSEKSGSVCCKTTIKTGEKQQSGLVKNNSLDYCKTTTNKTNYNYTDFNQSNHIPSGDDAMGKDGNAQNALKDYEIYKSLVKKNIDYDYLVTSEHYRYDKETINGIVDLMVEVMTTSRQYIVICGDTKPRDVVKSQLMKLNMFHIQYVIDSLKKNDTKVRNMKQYMLAALYNAPITIDSYYGNLYNSDQRAAAEKKASGY